MQPGARSFAPSSLRTTTARQPPGSSTRSCRYTRTVDRCSSRMPKGAATENEVERRMEELDETRLREIAASAVDRVALWTSFLQMFGVTSMAEVGVYRGDYAARMLREAPGIEHYYMIDPWRHLDDWNKPANQPDDIFERFFTEAMDKTAAYADKRVVLRGRTVEVVDQIPDGDLDLVYIDGDHTLRGITVNLTRLFPKVKDSGFVAGDDFCRNIFQHGAGFEPTLVFPYAVYFAEAVGAKIYALPYKQFVMQKVPP